jgi:lipoprotein-anchoring transpeptidase ErfK/SrfK
MKAEPERRIIVSVGEQRLRLFEAGRLVQDYRVSTGFNGLGEEHGSGCTPRGLHRIRIKIGANCPKGAVFVGRRPTGEVYCPELAEAFPQRDWILSRILWLTGMEQGRNRGGWCDTLRRFIYIHGTPDSESMGVALSHGCIRMGNDDLIELFDRVRAGDPVLIQA